MIGGEEKMLKEAASRGLFFAFTVVFGAIFTILFFIGLLWCFNKFIGWETLVRWIFKFN